MPAAVMGIPAGTAATSVTQMGIATKSSAAKISMVPPTEVLVNFICFSPFQSKIVFQTFVCIFEGIGALLAKLLGKLHGLILLFVLATSTVRLWVLLYQISPQFLLMAFCWLANTFSMSPSNNASAVSRANFSS